MLKNEKVVLGVCRLSFLLFLSGSRVCNADSGVEDSDLREIQTNLVHSYGIKAEDIAAVPLNDIKSVLENPPNIKDAVFRIYKKPVHTNDDKTVTFLETNFYRCGFSTNGYCFAVGFGNSDITNLSALGNVMGRFGTTNWRASGSGIIYGDGKGDNENILGSSRSSLACLPLRLGVVPLVVGSARFQGNNQFEARDTIEGKLIKGRLILAGDQNASGIKYEIDGLSGCYYMVIFLSDKHQSSDKSIFPLHRWATFAIAGGTTNFFISMADFSSIQVTRDDLLDNYFLPSRWLSHSSPIPVVDAYIVKNQIMVKMDGRLVPATPNITFRPMIKIYAIRAFIVVLLIAPVVFVVWTLKRKVK